MKMFRFLSLMLFFSAYTAQAQQLYVHKAERCRVEYRDGHFLRQKGNTLHFVKLNVEWPVCLNYDALEPLHQFLAKELFGNAITQLDGALNHYLDSLGTPLAQVPEGQYRTYYVTLDLAEVEYVADRYISMRLVNNCEPKDTSEVVKETQRLITYDLINNKVMTAKELLKTSAKKPYTDNWWQLTRMLLYNLPGDWVDEQYEVSWEEACLMRVGLVVDMGESYTGGLYHQMSAVSEKDARQFLSKEARALLDAPLPSRSAPVAPVSPFTTADTAQVYVMAEEMPRFQGMTVASPEMTRYMVSNVRYPQLEELLKIGGRVVVQLIVEKDGSVSSIAVMTPVSPGLDREAVRFISQMPKWQPGRIQGQPVRVLLHLPVTFRINE